MATNRTPRPRIKYGPRRPFDGVLLRTITVLVDDVQSRELQRLRVRCSGMDDATFWPIVIGDGASLLDYELNQADGISHPGPGEALPATPGPTRAMVIPVEDGQLKELQLLRRRRPEWEDALFWQQVLDWGTCLLPQILDREDGDAGEPAITHEDDEIPF